MNETEKIKQIQRAANPEVHTSPKFMTTSRLESATIHNGNDTQRKEANDD